MTMTRIPLAVAYLCEDCQCLVDSAVECECGSKALMCMAAVLNRGVVVSCSNLSGSQPTETEADARDGDGKLGV